MKTKSSSEVVVKPKDVTTALVKTTDDRSDLQLRRLKRWRATARKRRGDRT